MFEWLKKEKPPDDIKIKFGVGSKYVVVIDIFTLTTLRDGRLKNHLIGKLQDGRKETVFRLPEDKEQQLIKCAHFWEKGAWKRPGNVTQLRDILFGSPQGKNSAQKIDRIIKAIQSLEERGARCVVYAHKFDIRNLDEMKLGRLVKECLTIQLQVVVTHYDKSVSQSLEEALSKNKFGDAKRVILFHMDEVENTDNVYAVKADTFNEDIATEGFKKALTEHFEKKNEEEEEEIWADPELEIDNTEEDTQEAQLEEAQLEQYLIAIDFDGAVLKNRQLKDATVEQLFGDEKQRENLRDTILYLLKQGATIQIYTDPLATETLEKISDILLEAFGRKMEVNSYQNIPNERKKSTKAEKLELVLGGMRSMAILFDNEEYRKPGGSVYGVKVEGQLTGELLINGVQEGQGFFQSSGLLSPIPSPEDYLPEEDDLQGTQLPEGVYMITDVNIILDNNNYWKEKLHANNQMGWVGAHTPPDN